MANKIPTTMGTCTRCGGKFTSGNGITEPGPYCFSAVQCDANIHEQAALAAHALAEALISAMDRGAAAMADVEMLCLTEQGMGSALGRVLKARGSRPQTTNEAIDDSERGASAAFRLALKMYARGESIATVRARYLTEVVKVAPAVGTQIERLHAALYPKGCPAGCEACAARVKGGAL